ncbi:MAG: hypothetical protein ACKPKO_20410, partial [Candidatus Fonsibacter sp.]
CGMKSSESASGTCKGNDSDGNTMPQATRKHSLKQRMAAGQRGIAGGVSRKPFAKIVHGTGVFRHCVPGENWSKTTQSASSQPYNWK